MKPRTQINRRVTELSATLHPVLTKDIEWIDKDYRKTYKNKGLSYYLILERCQEFQVVRYYYRSRKRFFEFLQVWIDKDCNEAIRAKRRFMRVDGWVEDSEMKLWKYQRNREYSYLGGISRLGYSGVKIRSLLPELKKRGLKTSTHGIHPVTLIKSLLSSNRLETLFKVRQYRLVHEFSQPFASLDDNMWQSIRVALRHGYHLDTHEEFENWYHLIGDLSYLGLDTRNPHYICPANLAEAHQYYMGRVRKIKDAEYLMKQMKLAQDFEPIFHANREQFLDMAFSKGRVSIQIIPTAVGIKQEGEAMHHCVGCYYNRLDSLILSAKVDGKRMETIEVSLTDYRIVQSRGILNKNTNFHNLIVHLMKQGLPEIKKRNEEHKLKIAV